MLGDAPACGKSGGDATFCAGGIEWVRGGHKFYIMLWRKEAYSEALGKALITTARQDAAQMDTAVTEALQRGVPLPRRPAEPPIVRSRVVVFDRSNCLSTAEGYKQMVEAVGSAAAMMDRRYAFARDQAPPSAQTSQDMGAFEMALIGYDGRNSTLESDFTHQGKDIVTAVSRMHGRAQIEQTGAGAGGATGAGAQDLATYIARAALHANMFGRGVPDVAVVTCGAKPAMSAQTAKVLERVLARLAVFSRYVPSATGSLESTEEPHLGSLPAAGRLPWWARLVQAALGQTVPRTLGGPNDTLEALVAEWDAAGTRAQKPTRVNTVGIRFPTGGEQEQFLVSVCNAAGGRYVPAATVSDMPRSFLSLFPEAGQPWPQPTGANAGPQVAQIPGGDAGQTAQQAGADNDELRLRDGRVLRGTLVSADDRAIIFRTGGEVASCSRPQVAVIILGQVTQNHGLPPEISLARGRCCCGCLRRPRRTMP